MTPQELKNSIIQLAIQGKLVEQKSEEGTAKDQLNKRDIRPLPDNGLIEIPESWCWARLVDLSNILYGFPFNSALFNESRIGMPVIRIRDINNGQTKTFSNEQCEERYRIKRGDMLVGMDGNFQVAFWDSEDAWLNQRVCRITADKSQINQNYLFYYLPTILAEINGSVSFSTVKHLSAKILNQLAVPLPPLSEQNRIVAKIEELLPLVEQYEKVYNRLEQLNKQFPIDIKKSILQLAIQGKLVEQRSEEGTGEELYKQIQAEKARLIKEGKLKKEKPLPAISEDEIPFDIPDSWKLVRLAELCKSVSDGDHQPPPQVPNGVPFLVISNVSNGFLDFSHTRFVPSGYYRNLPNEKIAEYGDILFTVTGSYGIPVKVNSNTRFCFQRHMALLKLISDWDYLYYALKSPVVKTQCDEAATGTAQKTVGLNSLRNILIPLPPLAEQKRIVAKIEELLPLCDLLNRNWN